MKYLFFILLLLSCTTPYSRRYYAHVNKAEQAIIDNRYSLAIRHYRKAFKYPMGFADHYFNAFKVSIQENNLRFAEYNAAKLLERGLCLDFFEQYPMLSNYVLRWNRLSAYKPDIDQTYRIKLQEMMDLDQTVSRRDRDATRRVFQQNYDTFKKMMKTRGYPTESSIGLSCTPNRNGFFQPPQDIMLLHFAQARFPGLDTLLSAALQTNSINAFTYATVLEQNPAYCQYCTEPLISINDTFYMPKFCVAQAGRINRARKCVGLPTIEQEIKTIRYKMKHPDSEFRLNGVMVIISEVPQTVISQSFILYRE